MKESVSVALAFLQEELARAKAEKDHTDQEEALSELIGRLNQGISSLEQDDVTQQVLDLFAERTTTYEKICRELQSGRGPGFAQMRLYESYYNRAHRFSHIAKQLGQL